MKKIPTGLSQLDAELGGGLFRQSLVTILGHSNSGKSLLCTSFGCSALRNNLKVLHIKLEESDNVLLRYTSNLTEIDYWKILDNQLTPEEKNKTASMDTYQENLIIKDMLNWGATVEEVIAYCRKIYVDFKFDMVIVDYGQLLHTKKHPHSVNNYIERNADVYRGLDFIAKEFDCVVISPIQAFGRGIQKQKEDKSTVLKSEYFDHYLDIAQISKYIFTLNRTKNEELSGSYRLFLEKAQRGQVALTYGIKAQYGNSNLLVNDYYQPTSLGE